MHAAGRRHGPGGFTLIELLVVIAILGLIMAIILVSLNTAQQRARDSKRASDMGQLVRALEMYRAETGVYPANEGATAHGGCTSDRCLSRLTDALVPTYLPYIPTDPVAGNTSATGYRYCRPATHPDTYQIIVRLEKNGSYCTVRTPVTITSGCWTSAGVLDVPYCN